MARKIFAVELAGDRLGLLLQLEVARLELGAVLLEALEVVGRCPQRLLLRQQEVARVAILDVDQVAHLAETADALQKNDLHAACSVALDLGDLRLTREVMKGRSGA